MSYVIRGQDAKQDLPLGGKARALAALATADLPIPAWVVLLPQAFYDSLSTVQRAALDHATDPAEIRSVVAAVEPAASIRVELADTVAQICAPGERVAVRSSASDEDGAEHSFAGQLDSFLFVAAEQVADKAAAVWRSGFSERIVAYRREHGLGLLPRAPAVLIQRMVDAAVSGVAFGADPVSGRRGIALVSALYGMGTALVSGEADADAYHVDRDGRIVQRTIAHKRTAHRPDPTQPEGVRSVAVEESAAGRPALSDEQIVAVARLVRNTGRFFGRPQDIEWAIADDKLYLLQSRPITSLAATPDPDGALNIWDNSNIAESYNGVTTPLTFSFARRAYEEVYRQFCRILRVPRHKLETNDQVFRQMLGLVRGRIYYNLLSWYRVLALLPGFTVNRRFMEQMMGVKEGLPENLVQELTRSTWSDRLKDRFNFLKSLVALTANHYRINSAIRRFYERLENALGIGRPAFENYRPDELVAHYRHLESQLLTRWDAPLINDFLAMIFYGLLRKLTEKWCGDKDGTLQNDLIAGIGGMISAEPAVRVARMAEIAAPETNLVDLLCQAPLAQIRTALARLPQLREEYDSYLDKFGDRCMEELKLESATLHDDPLTLLRSIGQLARRSGEAKHQINGKHETDVRHSAEERVQTSLRFRPLRRLVFRWVLKNARCRVRDRENLRFERTRLFGRVRQIFVELGRKYYALDRLADPRDVFYLEADEALGLVDGTVSCTDLKGLVAVRKAEFERYRSGEAPPDRFETHGVVEQGQTIKDDVVAAELSGDQQKGLGCCPGVVRGPVRVITDPRSAVLARGDILVAERTDPGWIMLFPSAAGLLVERGSLLSHSAIVAREMRIPAIVSISGVTRWLKDGDWVELNGATGVVSKLPKPEKVDVR